MKYWIFFPVIALSGLVINSTQLTAHTELKKEMSTNNKSLKVTCNACHVKGKKKDVRNEFGETLYKEFKSAKFSEEIAKFTKEQKAEKKKYIEDKFLPEFRKAWKKVVEKDVKNKKGEKWGDLIKSGKLPGTKLKKKKK